MYSTLSLVINNKLAQTRPFEPALNEVVNDVATIKGFEAVFNNILVVSLGFAGIVFFFILIASGFTIITAGGEPQKLQQARKGLTLGIGGLMLILIAYLIILFFDILVGQQLGTFRVTQ